jgi:serine/threonine protein kinase/Flp pilus assembly protein TadD
MAEAIGLVRTAIGDLERWTMQPGSDTVVYDPILRDHPQVSGYRLIARRGRGGGAEVWEAESPGGHGVALRIVHLTTDLRSTELRALKITRGIRHPSLVIVHGAWQVENLLVISMELADRSLWDRFLEANAQGLRGIPRGELLGYLDPIADAIDYLNGFRHTIDGRQGVGIQHRDLKPQNLLLFGERAKVGDFGMARAVEGYVSTHSGPCTVPYAAPEYFDGRTALQSDQYSLAVTYCHLRGGRVPFPGTTAQMAIGHMCNAPDLEGLPAPERPTLERALAKRPEDRWPDCRSFVDALDVLGTARGCSIPDALPRDRCGHSSEPDGEVGFSPHSIDRVDTDFIPVDSGEFESPLSGIKFTRLFPALGPGPYGFGLVSRVGTWILDHLLRYGHELKDRLEVGWPTQFGAIRRAAWSNVVGRDWSARRERVRAFAAMRLDRGRQIGSRVAQLATALPGWLPLASIAVLFVLVPVLWNLVGTSPAPRLPAQPSHEAVAAESVLGPPRDPAESILGPPPDPRVRSSDETGITQGPTLELPIIGAEEAAPVIPPSRAVLEKAPRAPVDSPKAKQTRPSGRLAAAKPKDSSPKVRVATPNPKDSSPMARVATAKPNDATSTTAVVAAEPTESPLTSRDVAATRPKPPAGTNPIPWGLESTLAWLQESASSRPDSTMAPPSPHRADANSGSAGTASLGNSASDAGWRPSDRPVAPRVVTPTIALPAEVKVTPGMTAKVHVRVQRGDATKPVELDLRGLPRGITATGLKISAGQDSTDVVLASTTEAPPGTAEVKVAFTAGSERVEAATQIDILPPPGARVAYQRGLAAFSFGSFDRAIADFSEVIRLDPKSSAARFHRGVVEALTGRSQEALADYTAAIQLQPDRPEAYLERARVYIRLGAETLALNDYNEAIRLRADAEAYLARAGLHHEMGTYDQALADCDRALRLRSGDPAAFFLRGLTRYHSGDYAGAVADFTEVIRRDPNDARAYCVRGDAHARLGQRASAEADHGVFERLSRAEGAPNKPGGLAGEGRPGAGRGQSP